MWEEVQNKKSIKNTQTESPRNKVIYIGNFNVSFSTECHVAKSFESLGWEVIRIQENKMVVADVIEKAKDCKFLLYTRT